MILFLINNHCIAGGLHLACFQYVQHPNDTSLTAQKQESSISFVQKCFGAIKHFRSSTPHTSLDGSRIIKAIQTQNKALINTPSSGFEVRLRHKYLLIYIVVQVIFSCGLFPVDKIQEQSRRPKKAGTPWGRVHMQFSITSVLFRELILGLLKISRFAIQL